MAGDRGRGNGRSRGGGGGRNSTGRGGATPQRGAFGPSTPSADINSSFRGRGRGRHGGGRATPDSSWKTGGGRGHSPAGGYRGYADDDAALHGGFAGSGRGAASVDAEDRQLLLVSKDQKMQHVWELRVHPSKRFGSEWLAAVDRWALNMTTSSGSQHDMATPSPAQYNGSLASTSIAAAAAAAAPVPDEPTVMHDDDYDYDYDSSSEDSSQQPADGHHSTAGHSNDSDASTDDDVYDMVSYLRKVSLADDQQSADDNVSTAATAGSSVAAARSNRGWRNRAAAKAGAQERHRRADDSAAEDNVSADSSDSSSSWETDDEELELQLQGLEAEQESAVQDANQPALCTAGMGTADNSVARREDTAALEGGTRPLGSASSSSTSEASYAGARERQNEEESSAMDAALEAAEERDLLGEFQQRRQQGRACKDHVTQRQATATAEPGGGGRQRERKQRRGERKRERWQKHVLVSLRLEKQGLTDKEAQLLLSWYSSSAAAQHLSVAKLWLFDNALGDAAAAALAPLIGPSTTEIHLSHNQISVVGAKALLEKVPLQRTKGLKPLWLRIEWNQIDAAELRRFIEQGCAARGLVVDIAKELPVSERTRSDTRGRELNLAWSLPWQSVHVQMPWLSCQRSKPEEAAVLQAAKAVWGGTAAGRAKQQARSTAHHSQQRAGPPTAGPGSTSRASRMSGVVAAMNATAVEHDDVQLPFSQPTPPPPPQLRAAVGSGASSSAAFAASAPTPSAAAAAPAGSSTDRSAIIRRDVAYQDGPLMLFVDTSAFLAMLGCPGNVTTSTRFTMKLLQALAGSGRFGRDLPPEQQTFIVLADTVLKQLDSFKSAEGGVGGPVRKFLDKGLDEVGPKGLDFLTVLAAHEGEGLVVDRQAAVAGSRSPGFAGSTGQRSDLAIIEVGLFFRTELLAAAAMAAAACSNEDEPVTPTRSLGQTAAAAAEAQPVILVTNDNAQLQLSKAHGLPAFKLAGATDFESQLSDLIKSGGDLTSRTLRQLMAPTATAGLGAIAGRSLQDDFDGAVSCTRGLLEAYQDLSGLLGRVNMLVSGVAAGEESQVLQELQQLLQDHQHVAPFEESNAMQSGPSVLEVAQGNIAALENSLQGWEGRIRGRHTPSRVLKWANSGVGRTPAAT